MSWKPIIVGVNGSEESVRAAATAVMIASRAGVSCIPVFAGLDYTRAIGAYGMGGVAWMATEAAANDREAVLRTLHGWIPEATIHAFESSVGRAPVLLSAAAHRWGAGLIVIGARRYRGRMDRIGHDTAVHLVRAADTPVLVAGGSTPVVRRILAAVDVSAAACPTIEAAREWGRLFNAPVRVVHAIEPMPGRLTGRSAPAADATAIAGEQRALQLSIDTLVRRTGMDVVVRRGPAAHTIVREVARYKADLLVLGAHGRGFVNRLLVGSTTERLLRRMPTMMLVVRGGRPAAEAPLSIESLPWEECETVGVAAR